MQTYYRAELSTTKHRQEKAPAGRQHYRHNVYYENIQQLIIRCYFTRLRTMFKTCSTRDPRKTFKKHRQGDTMKNFASIVP